MLTTPELARLAAETASVTRQAGALALDYYQQSIGHQVKEDGSPVTAADQAVEAFLTPQLQRLYDVPLIGEETYQETGAALPQTFWLIDPIDGTQSFVNRTGMFTVLIGLMHAGYPLLGVVHAVVPGWTAVGYGGTSAYRLEATGQQTPLRARDFPSSGAIARYRPNKNYTASGKFDDVDPDFVASVKKIIVPFNPSIEHFDETVCRLITPATSEADIVPKIFDGYAWDNAPCQAVVEGAGGEVLELASGARLWLRPNTIMQPPYVILSRGGGQLLLRHLNTKSR